MNLDVGNNWLMIYTVEEIKHWKRLPQDMRNLSLEVFKMQQNTKTSSKFSAEFYKFNLYNFINPIIFQDFKLGISAEDRDVLMHPKITKEQERRLKMLFYNFESSRLLPSKGIGQKLLQVRHNSELSGMIWLPKLSWK